MHLQGLALRLPKKSLSRNRWDDRWTPIKSAQNLQLHWTPVHTSEGVTDDQFEDVQQHVGWCIGTDCPSRHVSFGVIRTCCAALEAIVPGPELITGGAAPVFD
jgi:hypothetical protein